MLHLRMRETPTSELSALRFSIGDGGGNRQEKNSASEKPSIPTCGLFWGEAADGCLGHYFGGNANEGAWGSTFGDCFGLRIKFIKSDRFMRLLKRLAMPQMAGLQDR